MELAAARAAKSVPVLLEGGHRLDADASGASYRFSLIYDSAIPEGVPVRLVVGRDRWDAEVLQRKGVDLVLLVRRNSDSVLPRQSIPSAQLFADASYLIELLSAAVSNVEAAPDVPQPCADLLDRLTGTTPARITPSSPVPTGSLNPEQADALARCSAETVWFVWGPPGTGKTTTLGHVVAAAAASGASVLVTAHSNVAVDAALLAALSAGDRVGRSPVRAGRAVLEGAQRSGCSTRELAFRHQPELKRRYDTVTRELARAQGRSLTAVIERWRKVMKDLRKAEEDELRKGRIVFATQSKLLTAEVLAERMFDVVIVDEVSMSYPAQVVVAASRAKGRLNVLGDCRQLPPIVQSEAPLARERLGRDVFTACGADRPGAPGVTMLREQFRMHPAIRQVVSDFAYGGALRDAPGAGEARDPIASAPPVKGRPVVWHDPSGLGASRFFDRERGSRFNPVSALCSIALALEAGDQRTVLLTPYRSQARLLAALVADAGLDHVGIGTIHRYQGSEAPMVILDLVDGTGTKVGTPFEGTSGERLLNVGLSRAQGKVIVVCNRTMPVVGLSRRSTGALRAVRHAHLSRPDLGRHLSADGFGLAIEAGLPAEVPDTTQIVAAWLPDVLPPGLEALRGPHAQAWEPGHATWLDHSGRLTLFTGEGARSKRFVIEGAPRFAEALADAISGAPLSARRRGGPEDGPGRVARHDRCNRCDGEVVPLEATRYAVELTCTSCGNARRASEREIQAWLRQIGPCCPSCRQALRLISGRRAPHGPFLSCTGYPYCTETLELAALIDAVTQPDPPPIQASPPPASPRRRPARTGATAVLDQRRCESCFLTKPPSQFTTDSTFCTDCV